MKKKTKIIIAIFVILFLIIGIIAGVISYVNSCLKPTKEFLNGEICNEYETPCEVTPFIVDEGAFGKSTLEKLEENGIIKDADIVYYYNRIFSGFSFTAGFFELPHQMEDVYGNKHDTTLDELMGFLSDPKNAHQDTVTLSFDEGDFIKSFAQTIADNTTVTYQELMDYWNNQDVIKSYMSEYPFLTNEMFNENVKYYMEGYLFPDTYEFF